MYDFINEVLYEMKADGELEVPVGILNVTEFKGVALAEHALEVRLLVCTCRVVQPGCTVSLPDVRESR